MKKLLLSGVLVVAVVAIALGQIPVIQHVQIDNAKDFQGSDRWEVIHRVIELLALTCTAAGVWAAVRSLKATERAVKHAEKSTKEQFEQNKTLSKEEFTMGILREWSSRTAEHRILIEAAFPQILDVQPPDVAVAADAARTRTEDLGHSEGGPADSNEEFIRKPLDRKAAIMLYWETLPSGPEGNWKARFAIIELLNYFEFITTACIIGKCDEEQIRKSFEKPLKWWWAQLSEFAKVVGECRGLKKDANGVQLHPWTAFATTLEDWDAAPKDTN